MIRRVFLLSFYALDVIFQIVDFMVQFMENWLKVLDIASQLVICFFSCFEYFDDVSNFSRFGLAHEFFEGLIVLLIIYRNDCHDCNIFGDLPTLSSYPFPEFFIFKNFCLVRSIHNSFSVYGSLAIFPIKFLFWRTYKAILHCHFLNVNISWTGKLRKLCTHIFLDANFVIF